jgi:hypothetical protein
MKRLLFLFLFAANAFATDSVEYMARIEQMVAAGAITKEAAQTEKLNITQPSGQFAAQRSLAQRGLASVAPELKPLKIKRFKARPMELLLD